MDLTEFTQAYKHYDLENNQEMKNYRMMLIHKKK